MGTKEDFIKIYKELYINKNVDKAKTLIEKNTWNKEYSNAFNIFEIKKIIEFVKKDSSSYSILDFKIEADKDNNLVLNVFPVRSYITLNNDIEGLIETHFVKKLKKYDVKIVWFKSYTEYRFKDEISENIKSDKQDIVNMLNCFSLDHFFKNTYYNGIVNYYIENKGNKSIINIYPVKGYVFEKDFDVLIDEFKQEFLKDRINKEYIFNRFYTLEEYDKYIKQQHTFFYKIKTAFGLWKN